MARRGLTARGFVWRWIVALVLVLGTFNPTSYSYIHWVRDGVPGQGPLKVLVGLSLVILYVIYMRATWRSLGLIGVGLAVAFFAALVWTMISYGIVDPAADQVMTYVVLVVLATVMAIGISWSHIRRRLSGQADTDDVGD